MAARLRAARIAFNPNAAEVARALGIHAPTLNAWELGRNFPSELFIVRVCDLFSCPVDWIYKGADGINVRMPPELTASLELLYGDGLHDVLAEHQQKTSLTPGALRILMAQRLLMTRTAYKDDRAAVAAELSVNRKVLYAYEVGRNFPDETFMVRFSDRTGAPVDWIMRGRMKSRMSPDTQARIAAIDPKLFDLG
jgi:transcriptional regulator with XRE-family HTH domain